ncbi:MAG: heme-binding protein, partial [Planctomycetes bacterium]|nr:heme-binding protein [Planctomycetota bacterium]
GQLRPANSADAPLQFNGQTRVEIAKPDEFNLHDRDFTITARIKTRAGGTILAKTSMGNEWVPNGKSLFVRGGRLNFDIGWVGVVQSKSKVSNGKWHDVAAVFDSKTGIVRLYVDGKPDSQRALKAKKAVQGHVLRIGYTASDFPGDRSFFDGEISEVRFYQRKLSQDEIQSIGKAKDVKDDELKGRWQLAAVKGAVVRDGSGRKHDGRVIAGAREGVSASASGWIAAGIAGDVDTNWETDEGNLRLRIAAGNEPIRFTLWMASIEETAEMESLAASMQFENTNHDLKPFIQGGPSRWPDVLKTKAVIGKDDGPFAVDVLAQPANNPWFCRMRLTGFDFYPDGDRAAVCAWDGSVWLVSGLADLNRENRELTWRRIASGLFQPLGLKIIDGKIYVTCRDQLCVLHDLNGDGEADFFENLNNDHQVTDHFHEFAMGLQTDADGNFYYAKSARHALKALVPHHGTLLRVTKDGSRTDILATGFRAANGVCINPDGTYIVTDQEGHWNPKNRINWVKEGGFYGNMFGYHDVTDSSDSAMQQPLCWITNGFDRSPSELMWVDSETWGPLNGSLLNFSYGYGKIYVVPHEEVKGQMQGGMCELPIPRFPTGVMRGRFHPKTGQLFACGMFAWAGNQTQPGGFYRVRFTGKPVHLPTGLNATKEGMRIRFSGKLDPASVENVDNFTVKTWSLKRTASYGSKHYDERRLKIARASLASDGRTVHLKIPEIQPTWCMEIRYSMKSSDGQTVTGTVHNTIHNLTK